MEKRGESESIFDVNVLFCASLAFAFLMIPKTGRGVEPRSFARCGSLDSDCGERGKNTCILGVRNAWNLD
jgi:hypothetical protein